MAIDLADLEFITSMVLEYARGPNTTSDQFSGYCAGIAAVVGEFWVLTPDDVTVLRDHLESVVPSTHQFPGDSPVDPQGRPLVYDHQPKSRQK